MSPDLLFTIAGTFALAVTLASIAGYPPKPNPYRAN